MHGGPPASSFSFGLSARRLAWLDRRQTLLANNIANANTPGYKARDLVPFANLLNQAQFAVSPRRTHVNDLPPLPDAQNFVQRATDESAIDGNDVSLDSQLESVAATESAQQAATGITTTFVALYRTALGR